VVENTKKRRLYPTFPYIMGRQNFWTVVRCVFHVSYVYRKESFPSKESDTRILQSIYFAYRVSSYSHKIFQYFRQNIKCLDWRQFVLIPARFLSPYSFVFT